MYQKEWVYELTKGLIGLALLPALEIRFVLADTSRTRPELLSATTFFAASNLLNANPKNLCAAVKSFFQSQAMGFSAWCLADIYNNDKDDKSAIALKAMLSIISIYGAYQLYDCRGGNITMSNSFQQIVRLMAFTCMIGAIFYAGDSKMEYMPMVFGGLFLTACAKIAMFEETKSDHKLGVNIPGSPVDSLATSVTLTPADKSHAKRVVVFNLQAVEEKDCKQPVRQQVKQAQQAQESDWGHFLDLEAADTNPLPRRSR